MNTKKVRSQGVQRDLTGHVVNVSRITCGVCSKTRLEWERLATERPSPYYGITTLSEVEHADHFVEDASWLVPLMQKMTLSLESEGKPYLSIHDFPRLVLRLALDFVLRVAMSSVNGLGCSEDGLGR